MCVIRSYKLLHNFRCLNEKEAPTENTAQIKFARKGNECKHQLKTEDRVNLAS